MALFYIDEQLCESCGTCAASCPMGIITMPKEYRGLPQPVDQAEQLCINCGHCMAICPLGAFTLAGMPKEQCAKISWDLMPSFEQLEMLVRTRRSIRVYKEDKVPEKLLARLVDAARYAPTGRNSQNLSWLVIQGGLQISALVDHVINWMISLVEEQPAMAEAFGLQRLIRAREAGQDAILRQAPALVIVHAPAAYTGGQVDATIALTTFELLAFSAGLGSCWAGFFQIAASQWPPLQEALALPEGHVSRGAMMLGYPDLRYKRVPQRNRARVELR